MIALDKYKIIYLIAKDCIIDTNEKKIFTTDKGKYLLYQTSIPLLNKPSSFDDLIVDYQIITIDNIDKKI